MSHQRLSSGIAVAVIVHSKQSRPRRNAGAADLISTGVAMKHTLRTFVMTLACLMLISSASAQDWPQWRGPNRDNHVSGFTEPKTWPKELTKKWTISVGV